MYGDLEGAGDDEVALAFNCNNGSGSSAGEPLLGWAIFSGRSGRLSVLGVVTPRAKHPPTDPPTAILIKIRPGEIIAHEAWAYYKTRPPYNAVTGWATTIWIDAHGALPPGTPILFHHPPSWQTDSS
jgi:hypothetical protein